MTLVGRVAAIFAGVAAVMVQGGCATCRSGSPVVVRPGVGGSIGSSGASTWSTGGVGLDLSNVLCRPPDPATLPQPGPGTPPLSDPPPAAGAPATPREIPANAAPI